MTGGDLPLLIGQRGEPPGVCRACRGARAPTTNCRIRPQNTTEYEIREEIPE